MSYLFWIKKLALMISINTRKFRPKDFGLFSILCHFGWHNGCFLHKKVGTILLINIQKLIHIVSRFFRFFVFQFFNNVQIDPGRGADILMA